MPRRLVTIPSRKVFGDVAFRQPPVHLCLLASSYVLGGNPSLEARAPLGTRPDPLSNADRGTAQAMRNRSGDTGGWWRAATALTRS